MVCFLPAFLKPGASQGWFTWEVLYDCHNYMRKKLLLPAGLHCAAHDVTNAQEAPKDTYTIDIDDWMLTWGKGTELMTS